ncbi:hypothetical protein D3C87_162460 [compost metagenome]
MSWEGLNSTLKGMKRLLPVLLILGFVLNACTGGNADIKKVAIADVQARFEEGLEEEAKTTIPNSAWLRTEFITFIKRKSEYRVDEVNKTSDTQARAVVTIKSILAPQRRMLAEIAGRIPDDKARNFNLTDALSMIAKKTGSSTETTDISINHIQVVKFGDSWMVPK